MRSNHELWLKERAINLAVQRLPLDWKYVAWIDADCFFLRHDWADETKHALQHNPIVQMWSHLVDLDQNHNVQNMLRSFMDVQAGNVTKHQGNFYKASPVGVDQKFGSPGLAWAARREAWNQLGGIFDCSILGAGDWYFANALFGLNEIAFSRKDATPPFLRKLKEYRGYGTRDSILQRHSFDPDKDLKVDWQGLYQLTDRSPAMRREIQEYFRSRNEDATV